MVNTKRKAPVSTATLPLLLEAIADPHATATSVADAVAHDAGLASRVLGLANSAQFGLTRTVSRLDMAVGLVGTAMVQTLAIADAAALLDPRGVLADRQDHAFSVAAAARQLAPIAGARPSDAFAAGLLHDVGELLLLQAKPSRYAELRLTFTSHAEQLHLEQLEFGTDHALLGAEHLLEWRVPDAIADAVADHDEPTTAMAPLSLAVAAADELVDGEPGRDRALQLLGIDTADTQGLEERVAAEALELVAIFAG